MSAAPLKWRPISEHPRDGAPFWGWLHQTGIRKLQFMTAAKIADWDGSDVDRWDDSFVEAADPSEAWEPDFWLPLEEIPEPQP